MLRTVHRLDHLTSSTIVANQLVRFPARTVIVRERRVQATHLRSVSNSIDSQSDYLKSGNKREVLVLCLCMLLVCVDTHRALLARDSFDQHWWVHFRFLLRVCESSHQQWTLTEYVRTDAIVSRHLFESSHYVKAQESQSSAELCMCVHSCTSFSRNSVSRCPA